MHRTSLRILVALLTFAVGVCVTAVWLTRKTPILEEPTFNAFTLSSKCFPGVGRKIDSLAPAAGNYFPANAFFQDEKENRFFVNWYTRDLDQMREPSILTQDKHRGSSYRFLWLRSFDPTVVVRVWSDGEKQILSVKELGRKNTEPKQILSSRTRVLTEAEWGGLLWRLDRLCFWTIPSTTDEPLANDGAWWVFEGAADGYYHVTTRQSPDNESYRELGLYMLKLSGLSLDESRIY